ncbi:MAG TPA: heme o synthase [Chthoniobacterales bacterium]|jgi:protoheme IX farnesyltransferase
MKAATLPAETETSVQARRSMAALVTDLVKARLTFLVLVTTLVGFCMGVDHGPVDYWLLLFCMLGTALSAGGAAALNQVIEREADAKMHRTRTRPVPTGEMTASTATIIGIAASVLGVALLWIKVNPLAAWASIGTIISYVLIYTPLKKISSLNTLVGAIPGALPPVIGYAASAGRLDQVAVVLFLILFFWQLPHFLAISWVYREDYLQGGFVMISARDASGRETAWKAIAYTILLIASTVLPYFLGINNLIWLIGSTVLGLGFLYCAVRFLIERNAGAARRLFYASIIYLPILLGLLVFTRS